MLVVLGQILCTTVLQILQFLLSRVGNGRATPEIPPTPPLEKGGEGGISGWRVALGKAYHFGCGSAALSSSVSQ